MLYKIYGIFFVGEDFLKLVVMGIGNWVTHKEIIAENGQMGESAVQKAIILRARLIPILIRLA